MPNRAWQAVEIPIDRIQADLADDMNSRNDTEILLRGAGFSAGIRPASAFPDRFLALRALWTRKSQRSQSRQVVGCHPQCEQLIDFLQPPHHHLSNWPDLLTPAETLFNAFRLRWLSA
ncbi:hypothetical protein PTKU64_75720 [Paraburkholderia terrae]|uniref:Uncharacterized protein n=1 Tax=Paraburkholderia terrae TaxID=311230 RepID=A0ABM7TYT7_9BURK|nr:hypothetical protein PTKU64_75720 [Paraburkholderia terrae]